MQSLRASTKPPSLAAVKCGEAILNGVPPVMWFWRQRLAAKKSRSASPSDLSVEQYRALCVIERTEGGSMTEVATLTGTSLAATSRLVDRLVNRGLLSRDESDADRRRRRLLITRAGRELLEKDRQVIRDAIAGELAGRVTAEQCRQIADAMAVLDTVFTAARDAAAADAN